MAKRGHPSRYNIEETKAAVLAALRKNFFLEGDGHSIVAPAFYTSNGFPAAFVQTQTHEHVSDGSYKGTIFKDGKKVKSVEGVNNLFMLDSVAALIGADTAIADQKIGRGFRAQELIKAIRKVVETP